MFQGVELSTQQTQLETSVLGKILEVKSEFERQLFGNYPLLKKSMLRSCVKFC